MRGLSARDVHRQEIFLISLLALLREKLASSDKGGVSLVRNIQHLPLVCFYFPIDPATISKRFSNLNLSLPTRIYYLLIEENSLQLTRDTSE